MRLQLLSPGGPHAGTPVSHPRVPCGPSVLRCVYVCSAPSGSTCYQGKVCLEDGRLALLVPAVETQGLLREGLLSGSGTVGAQVAPPTVSSGGSAGPTKARA